MKSAGLVFLLLLHRSYSTFEVVAPGTHNALIGSNTLVPCTFTVESPPININFLAILWQYGEKELIRYDNKEKYAAPRMSIDEDESSQGNASLIIHNVTIADQGIYKCLIVYSPNKGLQEVQVNIQAIPNVTLVNKALSKNRKNRLICLISNIFPKDIVVTWLRNGQTLDGSVTGIFEMNENGTYRVNSTVTISSKNSQDYPVITCQVDHVSLLDPIQDSFTVHYGVEPKISLFSSHDGNKEIFICEAKEFYPEAVDIKWLIDGHKSEPSRRNADGTYNRWNHFLISGNQKRSSNISCVVEHETLDDPLMESLTAKDGKSAHTPAMIAAVLVLAILLTAGILTGLTFFYLTSKKKYFQQFQLSPIHNRRNKNKNTDNVTMYCTASNCLEIIQVTWTVEANGKKVEVTGQQNNGERKPLKNDYTVNTDQSESDGLYNAITSLTFTPDPSQHSDMKVTCSFLSAGKTKKKHQNWSCETLSPPITAPMEWSLNDTGDVICSVTLEKFYPEDIQIHWSSGAGKYQNLHNAKTETFLNISKNTFNCKSECQVPSRSFLHPEFRVRVVWTHMSMNEPGSQEISAKDLPWRPVMGDIKVPPLVIGTEARFECVIRGYFPDKLEVKWLRKEAEKPETSISSNNKYKIPVTKATREPDRTYTYTTILIIHISATDQGAEVICRVTHPSLERPLEKRTGELTVNSESSVKKKDEQALPKGEASIGGKGESSIKKKEQKALPKSDANIGGKGESSVKKKEQQPMPKGEANIDGKGEMIKKEQPTLSKGVPKIDRQGSKSSLRKLNV